MASSRHREAGFSLVEAMVSIVLLSVGLLGTMHMLLASARASNEAETFTAAVNLVRELSEKARMNKSVSEGGGAANTYLVEQWSQDAEDTPAAASGCVASAVPCDAAQLAAWDMREWRQRVAAALPDARLSVCLDDAPWNEASGDYAWACSHAGRTLVVKLGWTPRVALDPAGQRLAPRLVMPLISVRVPDGDAGS